MSQDRARAEELVQAELAVEDVAAHEAKFALEIEGRECALAEDRRAEVGREAAHLVDRRVGRALALLVPLAARGKRIAEVLAEEASHVLAGRCQRIVDGAW